MSSTDEKSERRGLLPRFTLKDANTFLLADSLGDVQDRGDGLYSNDTRVLSRFELEIAGRRPSALGAAINRDNTLFTAHLTNLPLPALGESSIPQGVIHIERSRFLWSARLYEKLTLTNYSGVEAKLPLKLKFDADFKDIFEVQGQVRKARGEMLAPVVGESSVKLSYRGLDNVVRITEIEFSMTPKAISEGEAEFVIPLKPDTSAEMYIEIGAQEEGQPSRDRYKSAMHRLASDMRHRLSEGATITTSGRLFNEWLDKSRADLALLTTMLSTGPYPYAGIPWFATQFGRDAIITALQTLWINPKLGAGVLRFLASMQATEESAFRDSQPGKIMHEMRRGEMAALGEVPFAKYYGGVDTTPLFVMLAGAYEKRTGERSLADGIWSALQAAMNWIERRLKDSPTGFLDYARGEKTGLVNQSWKDSQDSMFHKDGEFPKGPVAVSEVQGYAYAAFNTMAQLCRAREDKSQAQHWHQRAEEFRARIEEQFWVEEMGFYAIALDGNGAQCKVYGSDAGHLLYCGVPSAERAQLVTSHLLSKRFASGWGIRTLAAAQARYNPMSYHNGSVWPHDTALCAAGISHYGERESVTHILSAIFEAALHFGMRLPELYCGFPRVAGQSPVPYPVACLPQAWSSGAVFMMLQACLGLQVDAKHKEVHIRQPILPIGVDHLAVQDMPVGEASIDLNFHRIGEQVVVVPARHLDAGIKVLSHL